MTPEGKVKNRLKNLLDGMAPAIAYNMPQGTGVGTNGVADFSLTVCGYSVKVETKARPSDKVVPLQAQFLRREWAAGAIAVVVDAENMDEFVNLLMGIVVEHDSPLDAAERYSRVRTALDAQNTDLMRWRQVMPAVVETL